MSTDTRNQAPSHPVWVDAQIDLFKAATGVTIRFSRIGEGKCMDACQVYRNGDDVDKSVCGNWHACQARSFHSSNGASRFQCPMKMDFLWAPVSYGGFLYGYLCTEPVRESSAAGRQDRASARKEGGDEDAASDDWVRRRQVADERILKVKSSQRDGLLLLLELLAQRLGVRFHQEAWFPVPADPQELLVRRAEAILCGHYHEDISTCDIADELKVSESHLCHAFQAVTRGTVRQHLNELRFKEACRLLKERPHLTVAEVAYASGFQSLSRFNEQFRRRKMPSPGKWRKADA